MMKKVILALLAAACLAVPALAQEDSGSSESTTPVWDHGDNVSDLFYYNVPVYRVYDQKDAYVVMYQKQGLDVGKVVLPKKWAQGNEGRKLFFRNKAKGLGSYMSVFYKAVLTVSNNRADAVWGVISNSVHIEGTDADTLEMEF